MKLIKNKYIILLLVIVIGNVLDRLTKILAVDKLADGPKVLIKGVLELRLLYNTGAAWGIFNKNMFLLGLVSVILIALTIWVYHRIPEEKKYYPLIVTGAFIVSGALGNMIDRFSNKGVVDFIYVSLINFPIFNVADIYVTCATVVLIVLILFKYKDEDFAWLGKKEK